jgi:hypothetical protein
MTLVKKCGDCPFWGRYKEMECTHSNNQGVYKNLINWDNVEKKPPKWCPLRKEDYNEVKIVNGKKVSEKHIKLIK